MEELAKELRLELNTVVYNGYVNVGIGKDKLCVYVQDDYLYGHEVKKLERLAKTFGLDKAILVEFHRVGSFQLCEGQ